jgi:exoribonuclease R
MIAANGVTARFLEAKGRPSLRRVLRTPKNWERIAALAKDLGDSLPATPDSGALNAFLSRRRRSDPGKFADLSLSVIKLMGSGE